MQTSTLREVENAASLCWLTLVYARASSLRVGFSWMAEQHHTAALDDARGGHVLSNQQLQVLMTETARKAVAEFARCTQRVITRGAFIVHVAVCPT